MIYRIKLTIALLALAAGMPASATVVIASDAGNREGSERQYGVFGFGSPGDAEATWQIGFSETFFNSALLGQQITGVGFRLNAGEPANLTASYTNFDVYIGKSAAPLRSLSSTFANNQGADTIVARSGTLQMPARSMIAGPGANPFFFVDFTNPYTFTGGPLLLTIRRQADTPNQIAVDATWPSSDVPTVNGYTFDAASGSVGSKYSPVTAFRFAPAATGAVPEPESWALMLLGFAFVGGAMRSGKGERLRHTPA